MAADGADRAGKAAVADRGRPAVELPAEVRRLWGADDRPRRGPKPALTLDQRGQIASLALKNRLPSINGPRAFPEAGGLMAYAASLAGRWHRAAAFVDKILKGAKPGELPVEQPTKFELVINMKTAKALRLTMPRSLLLMADEVIQ